LCWPAVAEEGYKEPLEGTTLTMPHWDISGRDISMRSWEGLWGGIRYGTSMG